MDIQNLVREKVIGNIKIGAKGENGLPKKLSYFNVEEDKSTNSDIVDIFKQLYPGEPTKLKIRFTNENPFNFKFKRYVNNKAVCIGNGTKAITIGKDGNGRNTQIEVECNEDCQHLKSGKCKLKGSLKFKLEGIEAGGVWNLSTTGGISLSNIASEIIKYKKAKMSIVDVPFELTLTEQQSLAYGTYYSIDLHRTDIKPYLIKENTKELTEENKGETKLLEESNKNVDKNDKKAPKKSKTNNTEKDETKTEEIESKIENAKKEDTEQKNEDTNEVDLSHVCMVKAFMPTIVSGRKFDKIIFSDINGQDVEYILHPKANQKIITLGVGTVIDIKETKMEMNKNILCKYDIKQVQNPDGSMSDYIEEELKEAV